MPGCQAVSVTSLLFLAVFLMLDASPISPAATVSPLLVSGGGSGGVGTPFLVWMWVPLILLIILLLRYVCMYVCVCAFVCVRLSAKGRTDQGVSS